MMNDVVKMLYDNWDDNRIVNRNYKHEREALEKALEAKVEINEDRIALSDQTTKCIVLASEESFEAGFKAGIKLALEIHKKIRRIAK